MPTAAELGNPPDDRQLSPRTGWTRAHWEWLADLLLAGVRPYAAPGHAFIHLPGGRPSTSGKRSDGVEGFARTFLLAAFRLGGSGGTAPGELADRYAAGLVAGTSHRSPEAWPLIDHRASEIVEAASIAIGLYETRPWIWDELSSGEQERVVDWLAGIHGKRVYPNNWFLFPVMVNAFLKSVGGPYRQGVIEENLDRIDGMHRGGGWYADRGRFDYYVGWAFHFYTLLWARMDGDASDPPRAAVYRERVRAYLEDYRHLFAANGAPVYHGRSLVYRWAAVAPVWVAALLDASPLLPGETRRLASGAVRYFLEAGAVVGSVLSMGWHGEFLPTAQDYSGPASPYWASKGFLGLLLPPDHPAWSAVEEPLAVEQADFRREMAEPGLVAVGTRADGIVRVLTKQQGSDPHYARLGYSTHTAPDLTGEGIDMQAALVRPRRWRDLGRRELLEVKSIPWEGAEIRVHRVAGRAGVIRTAGFALAADERLAVRRGASWAAVERPDGLVSAVLAVEGFDEAAVLEAVDANPFGGYSATPFLVGRTGTSSLVALIVLTGAPFDAEDLLRRAAAFTASSARILTMVPRCTVGRQAK